MARVLLVDDDIAEISAVKRVLARSGHQPLLTTNAADALAAIAQDPPAAVILAAGCENGHAVRRFVIADGARGIPLVILGESSAAPEDAAYVTRPVDPDQLAAQLEASISGAAAPAAPQRSAPAAASGANGAAAGPPVSRKAAARAIQARAEELRRSAIAAMSATDGGLAAADAALAELAPSAPAAGLHLELELDHDPGLEAILRRAEEAERAHAVERKARSDAERREREEAEARESARSEPEPRDDLDGELEELWRNAEEGQPGDDEDEEDLRAAIASARAELEALRRRGDEEARRRAEAEAEVARLAKAAQPEPPAPAPASPTIYLGGFAPDPPPAGAEGEGGMREAADTPSPQNAEDLARRRVAALRAEEPPAPAARVDPPPADVGVAAPVRPPPAELRSGTVADLPVPRLLALAARADLTGRIDVEGEASRSIYFEAGRVVGATSSDPSERIDELALRLGLVTRDQHRAVGTSAAPLATRRAAVVLIERGFLKPGELTGLVRRRTEEVVFGTFAETGARFRWAAAEVPSDERTVLERTALQVAVEGVRRRWLAPRCAAILGSDATLLAPAGDAPAAGDLGLSAEERRVLALADGLRTIDEIVAASPLDPLSTRQTLAACVVVGALAVRTFQGGRPAAVATAAIDLARVQDKLDQVRRADYFTILGVGRLCTPHEVREAFERLRAELDPRRFEAVREAGLDARLEEIQRVLADARDVLADDRLREEYLRGLGA